MACRCMGRSASFRLFYLSFFSIFHFFPLFLNPKRSPAYLPSPSVPPGPRRFLFTLVPSTFPTFPASRFFILNRLTYRGPLLVERTCCRCRLPRHLGYLFYFTSHIYIYVFLLLLLSAICLVIPIFYRYEKKKKRGNRSMSLLTFQPFGHPNF